MAVFDQPSSSYSDTTPQKRALSDVISVISPRDTPLLAYLGFDSVSKFNLVNWPATSFEVLENPLDPLTGNLLSASITAAALTITVDDASEIQVGDVINIDSEQMVASAVNTSTNVVTVYSRSYGGTNATHSDNADVDIIGMARLEGAESDASALTDVTTRTNYTQIFHKEIKVSRTDNMITRYGMGGTFDYYAMQAMVSLARKLELAAIRGVSAAGTATTPRSFAGLIASINTAGANTISAGGAVTQADFEDTLEATYNDGGNPRLAVVSPANMQVIKNFYDSSSFLRVERTETAVGMVVNQVKTPFGDVDLLMDRWMPDAQILLLDPDHVGIVTLEPWMQEPLAKTGDYVRGEVVGEFGLVIRHPLEAHGAIVSIS